MLQSLAQFRVALLQFFEQPHVLDGDHSLVGKGLQQLDLRQGERSHRGATCGHISNEFPLLTKGSGQVGAVVADGPYHWEIILRADVGNVERAVLAHPLILWLINTNLDTANGHSTKVGPKNHSVPIAES